MRQRLRLNAVRKNGFVVTVSIRPLNVASFNSLRDFCHQPGTRPQRIGSKTRLRGNHISRVLPDICGFVIELGTP